MPASEPHLPVSAQARIAELEAALAATTEKLQAQQAEHARLRHAYERLQEQLALMQRRLYVAKAERVDTRQLEIEFAVAKAALEKLATELGEPSGHEPEDSPATPRRKPTGRRDLRAVAMPEERIELLDESLEGKAERIGFEESTRLGYRRAGPVRIVVARARTRSTRARSAPW